MEYRGASFEPIWCACPMPCAEAWGWSGQFILSSHTARATAGPGGEKTGGGEGTTWLLGEVGGVEQSGSWGGLNPLGVHVPCDEAWGLVSWPCPCNEEEMGLASASIQRPRMQLCKPPITARSEALPDMNLLHT